ncbi:MAG: GntR family transcriptional regulator, partial [Bauldia sp.]
GILTKRRGIGMFVNIGARDKLIAERRARFFEEKIDPIAREANLIGIGVDEIVERLRAFKAEDGS